MTTHSNPSKTFETLAEWLEYCEKLHAKPIDLGLERVRAVAKRMDIRFECPVITVAGTNGKGSTCAMAESILSQARAFLTVSQLGMPNKVIIWVFSGLN